MDPGSETWVLTDWKTRKYIHPAVIRLYRRILCRQPDAHLTDEAILCTLGLPSPTELLRRNCLRYLSTLLQTDRNAGWGMLNQDGAWLTLVQDDFQWLWRNLSNSCDLGDPISHIELWLEIAQYHPSYWKRLIKRSSLHAQQQRLCCRFYTSVQNLLIEHDLALPLHKPVPLRSNRIQPSATDACVARPVSDQVVVKELTCFANTDRSTQCAFSLIPLNAVPAFESTLLTAR